MKIEPVTDASPRTIEPLTQMQRVLSSIDRRHFNLKSWFGDSAGITLGDANVLLGEECSINTPKECGTSACAVGHAFLDPWFVERGCSFNIVGTQFLQADIQYIDPITEYTFFWMARSGIVL